LIPLFKACTQLFDLVGAGRTCGTDFELLSTMLDIERVRLCLWGQRVGLVAYSYDQSPLDTNLARTTMELDARLEDRRVAGAVSDVLACVNCIFENSEALKQYGLQKAGEPFDTAQEEAQRLHYAPPSS
jgi:hypothetical protein